MKSKLKFKLFFLVVMTTIFYNSTLAQDIPEIGSYGLSALVQNEQIDIGIPIKINKHIVLSPFVGVQYVEDASTDLSLGMSCKIYTSIKKLSPYIGPRIGLLRNMPKDQDAIQDYLFGIFYGGEYFFSSNLSLGVEAQLNMVSSDKNSNRFGNPGGLSINTATAIVANIYF